MAATTAHVRRCGVVFTTILVAALLSAASCPLRAAGVTLVEVASGVPEPVLVTGAGDGSGRLFAVERQGVVRLLSPSSPSGPHDVYLDLRAVVNDGASEQGLLGLAFHPRFATNGRLYVNYTASDDGTIIAGFVAEPAARRVDANAAKTILRLEQPARNHNGGHLAFGPDGYLYVGTGDGGGAGDTYGNSQDPGSLLGKMLRVDVDRGDPYAVPGDNPFATMFGFRPEIWAFGLRHPWRYSFDRATGDLYIGDVGQAAEEEIDLLRARSGSGSNLGWPMFEGNDCYAESDRCRDAGPTVRPFITYAHEDGCSVTGGYVYRGRLMPGLRGAYVYGDYCRGWIRAARRDSRGSLSSSVLLESDLAISSFGEDDAGELYVADFSGDRVYRLALAEPSAPYKAPRPGAGVPAASQWPGSERR